MAKVINERQKVAELIYRVLTNSLCVREALLHFPKDSKDKSITTAYHALLHFDADEDLRREDLLYKDEQNDYLEFIAETLNKGNDLPKNIIKSYDKYYKNINTPTSGGMKGLINSLCKFLNV